MNRNSKRTQTTSLVGETDNKNWPPPPSGPKHAIKVIGRTSKVGDHRVLTIKAEGELTLDLDHFVLLIGDEQEFDIQRGRK